MLRQETEMRQTDRAPAAVARRKRRYDKY